MALILPAITAKLKNQLMAATDRKINSSDAVATVRDVTVTFDGYLTRSLARVSLDVRHGEVFGILGARGAGKSTMLAVLAGRMRATEGVVKVFGRSPRRGSTRARIGYVPSKSGSDQAVGFFSRLLGRKRKAQESARGDSRLTQAIIGGRDFIVLDEPFAEAAPAEKAELKTLIRELTQRGKTVVVASETLDDTSEICDRLAVLHEGRIQAIGSLEELLRAPGAVRFLAPVLPAEIGERIAKILRQEIKGKSDLKAASPASSGQPPSAVPEASKPAKITPADEHLASLTKSSEIPAAPEQNPKADTSIDHEKLEELTKSPKPE